MKFYLVGGAVRDSLLGVPVKDRDFVVVGSSPEQLLELGFEQVGMGFPVFLHPETREEHALARRDRKIGAGYTGFEFDIGETVTLVDDLERRDLTINSMAFDADGSLIDPMNGSQDLQDKILRHTSDAFSDDPLRVIRLARFFARYSALGFTVAEETMMLCACMVARGDLDELPNERFWREIDKALDEAEPQKFFLLLHEIGALTSVRFFKQLFGSSEALLVQPILQAAEAVRTVAQDPDWYELTDLRGDVFAALVSPVDSTFFRTSRAGNLITWLSEIKRLTSADPFAVLKVLTQARAWGEGHLANDLVRTLKAHEDASGRRLAISSEQLQRTLIVARTVTADPYLSLEGPAIGKAMADERLMLINKALLT